METTLPLDQIRTDAGTQTRAATNEETVAEYADRMLAGDEFPPVVVFHDGAEYVLADGFHRVLAAIRIGWESIETTVRSGTKLDALEYALGANRTNGLKRSNADKRRCVEIAIESFKAWSDRRVAEVCGVSHPFVASLRSPQLETVTSCRQGADGKMRKMPAPKAPKVETPEPAPAPAYVAPVEPEPDPEPAATIVATPPKRTYSPETFRTDVGGSVDLVLAEFTIDEQKKAAGELEMLAAKIRSNVRKATLNP